MRRSVRSLVLSQVVLVLAACGSPAVVQPSSDETASAPSPSAAPSVPVVVEAEAIPPDSYARVVVNDLPVRSVAGAPSDPTQPEGPLPIGLLVLVVGGPVHAAGVDWYLVQPTYTPDMDQAYPFGWVPAVGETGEAGLEYDPVECPAMPTDVEALLEIRQAGVFSEVTCFGGTEMEFRARIGRLGGDCPDSWGVDPPLFDCDGDAPYLAPLEADADGDVLYVAWEPSVDTSVAPHADAGGPLPIVEVKGMFDHPAAQTCRNRQVLDMGDPEPNPAQPILGCRSQFVVTAMRVIGR